MKRKTELLRRQIKTKFGSVAELERLAKLKKGELHAALVRIDKHTGQYFTRSKIDMNAIKLLISVTQPKQETYLKPKDVEHVRRRIATHWVTVTNFVKETGYKREKLYTTLRGERPADDLISLLDEKDNQRT